MAKLTGGEKFTRNVGLEIDRNIDHLTPLLRKFFTDKLRTASLPVKKEGTKKTYRANGWNTHQWFVRTGKSVVMKRIRKGLYRPEGWATLRYVKGAVDFWIIDDELIRQIERDIWRHI